MRLYVGPKLNLRRAGNSSHDYEATISLLRHRLRKQEDKLAALSKHLDELATERAELAASDPAGLLLKAIRSATASLIPIFDMINL
mgnify:CR=1 FL=1